MKSLKANVAFNVTKYLIIIRPQLHILFIENILVSHMVAVVMAIIQQLGKNSTNNQLTSLLWLLSINSHSNYSGHLIRSLFSENKCESFVCTERPQVLIIYAQSVEIWYFWPFSYNKYILLSIRQLMDTIFKVDPLSFHVMHCSSCYIT